MKQKLALACTLVHEPHVLLLDEPTTGVDPVSRREFWKLLSEFLANGLTIVMATPYLDEAERCARVVLLHEGQVLAAAPPADLQAQFHGDLLEVITDTARPPADVLSAAEGVADVQVFGDRAHVRMRDDAGPDPWTSIHAALARHHHRALSIRPIAASLEDVFIDLIQGDRTRGQTPRSVPGETGQGPTKGTGPLVQP
jgi:ABC-2 type transport system ATP-binding protein